MMKSRYALLWVLIALGSSAGHVQAKTVNQVVPFTQPDGTIFGARVFGDELEINWVTADGYAFVDSPTDDYLYYAELDSKGEYRASRAKVGIDDPATHGIEKHLQRSDARRAALQAERIARGYVRIPQKEGATGRFGAPAHAPCTDDDPCDIYVVMVSFADQASGGSRYADYDQSWGYTMALYNQFFNGGYEGVPAYTGTIAHTAPGKSTENLTVFGSVRAYFDAVSSGAFELRVRLINPADGDDPRWIELPQTKGHYAEIDRDDPRMRHLLWDDAQRAAQDSVDIWYPSKRITHPSMMEDSTMRTQTIHLTLTALLGLSGAQPATATDDDVADYLPLAVGNSWTYYHRYSDYDSDYSQWSTYADRERQLTITVERTEEIDDKTYYVLSDMPAFWPPAPPHFIAGKKLRWAGTHLMEYTGGEQALYRFDGTAEGYGPSTNYIYEGLDVYETEYDIPTVEGDNRVTVVAGLNPVPWYAFGFYGNGEGGRACNFLAGYGISSCGWAIFGTDYPLFINEVKPLYAVLGGTQVEYEDALIPTASSSSSWGQVKQSLLAHSTGGRDDQ